MSHALPDIPASELSAVVRAVRARPCRDKHLRAVAGAFAAILLIFLHNASVAAWNPSSAPVGAPEENQMLSLRQIAVVSSLAVSSSALAQNAVQWRVQDGGNGHWYSLTAYGQFPSFSAARGYAQASGGHLATITSAEESSFVFSMMAGANCVACGSSSAFIGAEQVPGTGEPVGQWRWITGEPWSFSDWYPGEPNNCCGGESVCALRCLGQWIDAASNLPAGSICSFAAIIEWSADCNNDGIVDYGQIRAGELVDTNGNNIPDCCEQGFECRFNGVQWPTDQGGNGHWYQLVVPTGESLSWEAARINAQSSGGHLATLTSSAESDFALTVASSIDGWWVLNTTPPYCVGPWLGGYQPIDAAEPAGGWRWVTDEPWSWTNWWLPANEPNDGCGGEDYLHWLAQGLSTPASSWNDGGGACGPAPRSYVIEWSADCNNDGIVDYGQIRAGELADTNANNIPDCCESAQGCNPCPADVDASGSVNGVDLAAILNVWGTNGGKYPGADVNHDGIVNGSDLAEVLNGWGPCP